MPAPNCNSVLSPKTKFSLILPLASLKKFLLAGKVMNTSLVPAPKLTALLLFELAIGVVRAKVFGDPV